MFGRIFKKTKYITVSTSKLYKDSNEDNENKPNIPEGAWIKCTKCAKIIYRNDLIENMLVCPCCGHHFRMTAYERIDSVIDCGTFEEMDSCIKPSNPLNFEGYPEKVAKLQSKTGLNEAVVTGTGRVLGMKTAIAVMDSRFMMASMGSAVGEKLSRMFEKAIEEKLPVVIFTASGGARMQEGMFSLMQMAKVSSLIKRHSDAGLLYLTVLTDPTTGGVTASFASLGDIIIAEPDALIGFAGRRVIEQTMNQKLPDDFQKAEFLLSHGFIDAIIKRKDMKSTIANIFLIHNIR